MSRKKIDNQSYFLNDLQKLLTLKESNWFWKYRLLKFYKQKLIIRYE